MKLFRVATLIFVLTSQISTSYASSIQVGKICPNSQFLNTVKQGSEYFLCVEGPPDGRSRWIKTSAPGSNGPSKSKPVTGNANFMLGYKMISGASVGALQQWNFEAFLSPNGGLTTSNAKDWCSQLPRVIVGLVNLVGGTSNGLNDWSKGCVAGALKLSTQ
jgi:hypothetical protein